MFLSSKVSATSAVCEFSVASVLIYTNWGRDLSVNYICNALGVDLFQQRRLEQDT